MEYVFEAFSSLIANRLRTVLALTGLVVGVAAVIAIQILGHATSGAFAGILKGFSNYTFLVQPNFQNGFDPKSGVTLTQLHTLESVPHVVAAIPFGTQALQASVGHQTAQLTFSSAGSEPGWYSEPFAAGGPFTEAQVAARQQVCIVSGSAFDKISPDGADVIGQTVRAGPIRCRIVGVLEKPASGALNFDFTADVTIPYTLYDRLFINGSSKIYGMQFVVDDTANAPDAEDQVKSRLTDMHNGKFTYQSFDNRTVSKLFDTVFGILTIIVGFIGAISLVVAGIGIMNILLVSIAERTREIGIRKAIGGTQFQIMIQFFMEAAALTFGGCALGAGLGVAIGAWINSTYIIKISGVIVPLQWQASVILAVVFAVIVTFAFGTYPAYRAARLDPIEALRYE